jgi:hypothetical protein
MLSALISDSWHGTDLEVRVSIVGIIATFFVWRLLSVLTLYSLRPVSRGTHNESTEMLTRSIEEHEDFW